MTKEDFVRRSEAKHGVGTYCYDNVPAELKSTDKVDIVCKKHGVFRQRSSAHYIQGQGCPLCAREHLWDKRSEERMTTERFKACATQLYGNRYIYDLSECSRAIDKVKIVCPKHGVFEQQAWNHLNGQGCPKCAREEIGKKVMLGMDEIESRIKNVHGDKYLYPWTGTPKTTDSVDIICKKHGLFRQRLSHHLNGNGCPQCARESRIYDGGETNPHGLTQKEFEERANKKHKGFYTYDKAEFVSTKKKVVVTCPKHGDFSVVAGQHLLGHGCPKCAREKHALRCRNTREDFIERSMAIHGDRYIYDKVVYKTLEDRVIITCKVHGDFLQTPTCHLNGCGCPKCSRSKGEVRVENYLISCGIEFETEKKVGNPYIFGGRKYFLLDFFLPKNNTIIEYNGEHHYKSVGYFGGEQNHQKQMLRDQSLRRYCEDRNINLIEIPYTEYNNVEKILKERLNIK